MKHLIAILMAVVALNVSAAELVKSPAAPEWYENISLAPVGVLKTEHLDGPSQWGAGLDIGYAVNSFVSLHVVNLAFEGPGQTEVQTGRGKTKLDCERTVGPNSWGGSAIDETAVQVDAKIARFSTETFSLHLVGGAQTDWNDNNYGVNVGARVQLDPTKHFGIYAGYDLRTWLKSETKVDSLVYLGFRITL